LFASKNLARIFSVLHENKVFFIRHFGLPPIIDTLVRYIVFGAIKRYTAPYKRRSDPLQEHFFTRKAAVYRLEKKAFSTSKSIVRVLLLKEEIFHAISPFNGSHFFSFS
jgi:hypothetical protein